MPATEADPTELIQWYHAAVWDEGDPERVDEFVADDFIEHSTAHPDRHGPSAVREDVAELRAAFPDLSVDELDTIAEEGTVVSRLTFRGTHDGPFQGIEPTGETVSFDSIAINRVENGRIVESWVQVDLMGLMRQLGVLDAPGG